MKAAYEENETHYARKIVELEEQMHREDQEMINLLQELIATENINNEEEDVDTNEDTFDPDQTALALFAHSPMNSKCLENNIISFDFDLETVAQKFATVTNDELDELLNQFLTEKHVRFDTVPVIFFVEDLSEYRSSRLDELWRDKFRFRRRVKCVENIVSPILSRAHRERIYREQVRKYNR